MKHKKLIPLALCFCMIFTGCRQKTEEADYTYHYTGIEDISFPPDESVAETAVKENIIRHMGFSIHFPSNWTNQSQDTSYIQYVPDEGDAEITVSLSTYTGMEDMDNPDILTAFAVRTTGANHAKAGTIDVRHNVPCWHMAYDEDGKYDCESWIYLVDSQHTVIYSSRISKEYMKTHYDEVTGIKESLTVSAVPTQNIPVYPLGEMTDLWSGIEEIHYGDNVYHWKDKLSVLLKDGFTMLEENDMLSPNDSRWIRLTKDGGIFLICVRNDSDIKRSVTDCGLCGIDAAYLFTGSIFQLDDFTETTNLNMIQAVFGQPVQQEGSMLIWELDGQDLYCSFSQDSGFWSRIAVVCQTEEEKKAREDTYIERVRASQASDWISDGFPSDIGGTGP